MSSKWKSSKSKIIYQPLILAVNSTFTKNQSPPKFAKQLEELFAHVLPLYRRSTCDFCRLCSVVARTEKEVPFGAHLEWKIVSDWIPPRFHLWNGLHFLPADCGEDQHGHWICNLWGGQINFSRKFQSEINFQKKKRFGEQRIFSQPIPPNLIKKKACLSPPCTPTRQ